MDTSHTESTALFDAESWFRQNVQGAPQPNSKTIKIVAGFTLLWNFFEDHVCNNPENANPNFFKSFIPNLEHLFEIEKSIDESLAFYQDRYLEGQNTNDLFENLHFNAREIKWKEHIKAVLKGEITDIIEKALALVIIVYRIRCNLFHGNKDVYDWNDQAENIAQASRILSIIIEAKGGFIIKQKQKNLYL